MPLYSTLLSLVEDICHDFKPNNTHWTFCVEAGVQGGKSWQPFGVVLPDNVQRLKKAANDYFIFEENLKQVRLRPQFYDQDLQPALENIRDQLNRVAGASWSGKLKKYGRESWPLIGGPRGFEAGILCDLVPILGTATSGAHMNIYEENAMGLIKYIWVAKRARNKSSFAGKLDQCVAGGLLPGEKVFDCIAREKKEEAKGIPRNWRQVVTAHPCIQYFQVRDGRWDDGYTGLPEPGVRKPFDLKLAEGKLKPNEAEIAMMAKMSPEKVLEALLNDEFKPNSALIMIDFMARHDLIADKKEQEKIRKILRVQGTFPLGIPMKELV